MQERTAAGAFSPRPLWMLLAVCIAFVSLAGCPSQGGDPGVLTGNVTIGPLSPVEIEGQSTPVPPDVYAARKVMVYTGDGNRLVEQVDISHEGAYRVELRPGAYTVDINHVGIDWSKDVPRKVTIVSRETVHVDIDIDTGIRWGAFLCAWHAEAAAYREVSFSLRRCSSQSTQGGSLIPAFAAPAY
jgi:hypothetical protein